MKTLLVGSYGDIVRFTQTMIYYFIIHIKKIDYEKNSSNTLKTFGESGVRTIAPEENYPLIRVRIRAEGQFSSGTIVLEPVNLVDAL